MICYIEVPFIDSDLLYRGALCRLIFYIEVPLKQVKISLSILSKYFFIVRIQEHKFYNFLFYII